MDKRKGHISCNLCHLCSAKAADHRIICNHFTMACVVITHQDYNVKTHGNIKDFLVIKAIWNKNGFRLIEMHSWRLKQTSSSVFLEETLKKKNCSIETRVSFASETIQQVQPETFQSEKLFVFESAAQDIYDVNGWWVYLLKCHKRCFHAWKLCIFGAKKKKLNKTKSFYILLSTCSVQCIESVRVDYDPRMIINA